MSHGEYQEVAEIVIFKAKAGVAREDLLRTVDPVSEWLKGRPGFISRDLTYVAESDTWIDLIWWETVDAANAAMELSTTSESCAAMFAAIDMESTEVLHGARAIAPVVADGASVGV